MSLTLEIVSRHRRALGEQAVKTFGQDGGTIGRSLESDWPLPDAQRFLSSKHASIDFRSGTYYIVDTSKNGVFINGAEEPVGRGKPQRLFPGDRIRIGEYEMAVSIENVDDTHESLLSTSHVDPVDLRQRVEAPDPTSYDLVDEQVITGVGVEMYLEDDEIETLKPIYEKFRTGASSSRLEQPPKASARAPAPAPAPARTAPKPVARAAQAANSSAARDPLEAFFRGAGIDAPRLNAKQTEQMLTQLGQVTRELIVGVIDCLHLRALQKARLKQANTTIQPRENNRLKFSANVEEGFAKLLIEDSEQYMSPVESVRTAFADIKHHQRALLTAMQHALDDYLDRLEPEQLERRASNGRTGTLINAANKLKYWDLYKDVYAIVASHPPDEMPQPFLDALAKGYEEAVSAARPKAPAAAKTQAG